MFLRYKDTDGQELLLEFRPDRTPRNRAAAAERFYSKLCGERRTWEQLKADALQGGIAARTVAFWIAMTDTHATYRLDDVPDFATGDLSMEYSKEELRRFKTAIESSDSMLEGEKAAALAELDRNIDAAPAGSDEPEPQPDPEVEEPGKAAEDPSGDPWTNFETSTG